MNQMLDIPSAIPSSIAPGSKVYKDDCMYCYDTAENTETGLDVCLSCYQSFSRGQLNHTKEHFNKTGHSLYLNIIKDLKPEHERNPYLDEKGERKQKIAKLEVRDLSEEEIYNIKYSIFDIKYNKSYTLDDLTDSFKDLVSQLLNVNSSNKQDDIKAWEQEITACEHSVDIQQIQNPHVNLDQCLMCDLKENLWICLHCGSVGCGREQFGSSMKGNTHALKHYETSGHPVAIKLGSLSAVDSDSYDAYCYSDNNEVKVFDVVDKLLTYKIDLKKATKTEKSLVELNLDQNLAWDFKLDGKNGEKLTPVFGKGLTGLQNLGNSCYLSSVVQSLFSFDNYQEYFTHEKFPELKDPTRDLKSQLIRIYDGLLSGRYSKPASIEGDPYQLGIKPSTFKTLIGESHPEFRTQRQQDAFEFLLYLMDKIDNEFGLGLNKDFKFLFRSKITCSYCSATKIKDELIDNLSVPIQEELIDFDQDTGKKTYKQTKLYDSLEAYCKPETIEGYKCDNCKAESATALKTTGFKSNPKKLILNVNRIKLENWVPTKVDVPIEVPYDISLETFKAPVIKEGEFEIKESTEEADEFMPDQEALALLLSMGFPEEKSLASLKATGNKDAEAAMNWIFANPEGEAKISNNTDKGKLDGPSPEEVEMVANMGFSEKLATKALIVSKNDPNAAVEWLFSNPDDDGSLDDIVPSVDIASETENLRQELENKPLQSPKYRVKAVVCHKGTSPHTGHYVAFVRHNVEGAERWVLFNDEKVVVTDDSNLDDIINNAYIYFLEQV